MNPKTLNALLTRFASRLRFPQLFFLTAGLFLLDLLIPDFIPFADEILLALATLLLGAWQRDRAASSAEPGEDSDEARFTRARRVGPTPGTSTSGSRRAP